MTCAVMRVKYGTGFMGVRSNDGERITFTLTAGIVCGRSRPQPDMVLSFTVTISIPSSHHFPLQTLYEQDKKSFIEDWIAGALSTIITGPVLPQKANEKAEVIVTLLH